MGKRPRSLSYRTHPSLLVTLFSPQQYTATRLRRPRLFHSLSTATAISAQIDSLYTSATTAAAPLHSLCDLHHDTIITQDSVRLHPFHPEETTIESKKRLLGIASFPETSLDKLT